MNVKITKTKCMKNNNYENLTDTELCAELYNMLYGSVHSSNKFYFFRFAGIF